MQAAAAQRVPLGGAARSSSRVSRRAAAVRPGRRQVQVAALGRVANKELLEVVQQAAAAGAKVRCRS